MFQREVPDRKCLKLRVSGADPAFVFVVELREACSHLSASRTRCGHDHERMGRLDVIVFPISVIADDQRDIGRIACSIIMNIHWDIQVLKTVFEEDGAFLSGKLCDDTLPK